MGRGSECEGVGGCAKQLNRAGYHAAFNASLRTDAGGLTSGVAVLSAWAYGLTKPSMPEIVTVPDPSRFVFRHFHGLATGGIGFGSVYLRDGVGLDEYNNNLLFQVWAYLRAWGRHFILAGDFNIDPNELVEAGWPQKLGAKIIFPDGPTYRSGGAESKIDFFIVENSIADAAQACYSKQEESVKKTFGGGS